MKGHINHPKRKGEYFDDGIKCFPRVTSLTTKGLLLLVESDSEENT